MHNENVVEGDFLHSIFMRENVCEPLPHWKMQSKHGVAGALY